MDNMRAHVRLTVDSARESIGFYSRLFAAQPSLAEKDFAAWAFDDPALDFTISARRGQALNQQTVQNRDEP